MYKCICESLHSVRGLISPNVFTLRHFFLINKIYDRHSYDLTALQKSGVA